MAQIRDAREAKDEEVEDQGEVEETLIILVCKCLLIVGTAKEAQVRFCVQHASELGVHTKRLLEQTLPE